VSRCAQRVRCTLYTLYRFVTAAGSLAMASAAAHVHLKGITLRDSVPAAGRRVGIVRTQWNAAIIDALVAGARDELRRQGVAEADIVELSVRARCWTGRRHEAFQCPL
jgi:hypothetical protein